MPFLPERMKDGKLDKFVANIYDKTDYFMHMRNLKQALNNGLGLKKVHRVIKFNQNASLKPYIEMNTDLTKKQKIIFKNIFIS